MTQRLWKFMSTVTTVMTTPVHNSLIQLGDTIDQAIGKLQSLLSVRSLRTVLTSPVTGGASTTANFTLMTLTVPANRLQVGDVLEFTIHGRNTKTNSGGSVIEYWVSIGGTQCITLSFTPGTGITNQPFVVRGRIVVRSIGGSGALVCAADALSHTTATAVFPRTSAPTVNTRNTTTSLVVAVGGRYSSSNAGNLMTAEHGEICQI